MQSAEAFNFLTIDGFYVTLEHFSAHFINSIEFSDPIFKPKFHRIVVKLKNLGQAANVGRSPLSETNFQLLRLYYSYYFRLH